MSKPALRVVDGADGDFVGQDWPLVDPGCYAAMIKGHETALSWGRTPRLYIHWHIVEAGMFYGAVLYGSHRIEALVGKPGKGGRFRARLRGDLHRMACLAAPGARRDRIFISSLQKRIWRVRIRTVTHDYRQRPILPELQYSVVDDVLAVEA